MRTVRVYTKPQCVQCTMTKTLLGAHKIPFIEEDATDPGNLAAIKELGFLSAPVVTVGDSLDDMWAGFQPDRIKELAARIAEEDKNGR
ncbi:glutaredoxin domain-containing protein [Leucobacter chromiiresistens]